MKQTLLIMVLALVMCTINGDAQTKKQNRTAQTTTRSTRQGGQIMKFRQVGQDGYVWYKLKRGNLCGVRDGDGNNIIPIKYTDVEYRFDKDFGEHWFLVKSSNNMGAYTREGTQVISTDKHYTYVDLNVANGKICWKAQKDDKAFILDAKGNEILSLNYDAIYLRDAFSGSLGGSSDVYYFGVRKNNKRGICDLKGNLICAPEFTEAYLGNNGKTLVKNINGNFVYEDINYQGGTLYFDCQPYDNLYYKEIVPSSTSSTSSNSSSASSSNSSSSSSNSGSGTTQTVVVEHHHNPIPVQQWQACFGCGGIGTMGCDFCGGSGTKYIGDRLHRCSRCNGQGIIPCNVCYGNKGQYITVYK